MIYLIDSEKYASKMIHEKDFNEWLKGITEEEYKLIEEEINKRFDKKDVDTAGWIPGKDWTNTVFEPISRACKGHRINSSKFFGLIVYKTILDRQDVWGCGKYEFNGVENKSTTYFELKTPPKK